MLTQVTQPSTDQFMEPTYSKPPNHNNKIVSCTNPGCNKKMKLKHFKNHYNSECPYTSQECEYCHQQNILRKNISKHHSKHCYLHNGRFKFLKQLSKTLQGQILLALDLHTNSKIIIKSANRYLVSKNLSTDGYNIPENFLNERHITQTLNKYNDCPMGMSDNGLVKWIASFDNTNYYYYAMKYYPLSLFDYIQYHFQQINNHYFQLNLPWIKIVQIIFKKLCEIIKWLHKKGYCHLDLSMENTMINPQTLDVTIIDLGTAKYFKNNNFMNFGIIGKTNYMSPEVYSNKMYYNAKSNDIYCLGSMLYTMLFGKRPYNNNNEIPNKKNLNNFKLLLKQYYICNKNVEMGYGIHLLKHIFRFESTRINLSNILQHPFINDENVCKIDNKFIYYSDILETIMMNKNTTTDFDNNISDEFLEYIAQVFEIERRNIIAPERMIYLYGMISNLCNVINGERINLYFGHLIKAKYWKKCVNINGEFGSDFVKFICCLNKCLNSDNTFEMRLYVECMNVYNYSKKKKNSRFENIIIIINQLFKHNILSFNIIFNQFICVLLNGKTELFDIICGFKLLKLISLYKNYYNIYYKEINVLINNISQSQNYNGKKLLIITKMIKNYWNEINNKLPPGLIKTINYNTA